MNTTKSLEVRELYRSFRLGNRELSILKDVNIGVDPGEFVAVMGQSGSGKSTLLHLIAGLLPASGGQIFVEGDEVTGLNEIGRAELRRHRIGFVFQNFNLMPQLTAEENVQLPLRVNGRDPVAHAGRVETLMSTMDVWKRRGHRPHQLSGGELQRVSVARALICEPSLILADEPTGNLASRAGDEVMRLLRESVDGSERRAALMVTHNPYDAARADRVLFLKDGVIDPAWELKRGEVDGSSVLDRLKELGI